MYLSRLILNPRHRLVRRDLADLYQLHRTLMHAFPDGLAPGEERILFRVDEYCDSPVPVCLVQSWHRPDWSFLEAREGYLLSPDPLCWEDDQRNPAIKPFNPTFHRGQVLAFRLRANPTVKRQGKRHALFREELQQQWMERKADQHGFRLLSLTIIPEGNRRGYQQVEGASKRRRLILYAVRFDGILAVENPVRFAEAVRHGIGPGKGLGFGLLSLAPPR